MSADLFDEDELLDEDDSIGFDEDDDDVEKYRSEFSDGDTGTQHQSQQLGVGQSEQKHKRKIIGRDNITLQTTAYSKGEMQEFVLYFVYQILGNKFSSAKEAKQLFWKKFEKFEFNFTGNDRKQLRNTNLEKILLNKGDVNRFIQAVLWYALQAKRDILQYYRYLTEKLPAGSKTSDVWTQFISYYAANVLEKTQLHIEENSVIFAEDELINLDKKFDKNLFSQEACHYYGIDYGFASFLHTDFKEIYSLQQIERMCQEKMKPSLLIVPNFSTRKEKYEKYLLLTYIAIMGIIYRYFKNDKGEYKQYLEYIYMIQHFWMLFDCGIYTGYSKSYQFCLMNNDDAKWLILPGGVSQLISDVIPLKPQLPFKKVCMITDIDNDAQFYKYFLTLQGNKIVLVYGRQKQEKKKKGFFVSLFSKSEPELLQQDMKIMGLKAGKTPYPGLFYSSNAEHSKWYTINDSYEFNSLKHIQEVIVEYGYVKRLEMLLSIYSVSPLFLYKKGHVSFNSLIPEEMIGRLMTQLGLTYNYETGEVIGYKNIEFNHKQ